MYTCEKEALWLAAQKDSLNHNLSYARLRDFCGYDTIFFNNLQYRIHQVITLNLHMFVIFWCGVIWMTFFAFPTRKKVLLKFTAFQPLKHFFFLIIKKIKIEWKSIIVMNHSLILLLSLILYFTKCEMWYLPHTHMLISSFANGHNKLLFLMLFTPRREHHKD